VKPVEAAPCRPSSETENNASGRLGLPKAQTVPSAKARATASTTPIQIPTPPVAPPQEAPPESQTPAPQGGPTHRKHSVVKHIFGHD
jgi:hypothetical protein